jgi:hypothetical protein
MGRGQTLYVKVLTYELSEADRTDDGFAAFVKRFADYSLPNLRKFGLLDGYLVRAGDDTIMTVNFYESEEGAHDAFTLLTGTQAYAESMHLTLIEHREGAAYDLPLSLGIQDAVAPG